MLEKDKLLSMAETCSLLNVSQETLRNWDADGTLKPVRTKGGHRRYKQSDINSYMGIKEEEINRNLLPVATYARVSSHEQKQKGDLDRQSQRLSEYCAKKKYRVEHIIKDVGSGLSDTRSGFNKLFDLVIQKKVSKVIVEHKDRLTRFQFNVLVRFFESYGVDIEKVESTSSNDEEELVQDIMMLMAVFSGRLYGKRSAKRRKEKKLQKELDLLNGSGMMTPTVEKGIE
ncbi:MAG: IS607 family transposase [Synergistaceae bacterium]|jgi:putative resolvase